MPKKKKHQPKRKRGLSPKAYKLIKLLQKHPHGKTLAELGRMAGFKDSPGVRQHAWQSINTPAAQSIIAKEMDGRPKLRRPALFKKLEQGLDAAETRVFQSTNKKGKLIYSKSLIDWMARKEYLRLVFQLRRELRDNGNGDQVVNVMLKLSDSQLAQIARGKAKPSDFINDNPAEE